MINRNDFHRSNVDTRGWNLSSIRQPLNHDHHVHGICMSTFRSFSADLSEGSMKTFSGEFAENPHWTRRGCTNDLVARGGVATASRRLHD